jgi:hypothetical protein
VKRPGLGLTALAVAAFVLLAPRPSTLDGPTTPHDPAGPLVGRILAPSFSSGEIQEQRYERSTKDSGEVLWVVCAAALALTLRRRSIFVLADPVERSVSRDAFSSQPSRAPPSLVFS